METHSPVKRGIVGSSPIGAVLLFYYTIEGPYSDPTVFEVTR